MIEKEITLENISLVDFLGVDNQNIDKLASAFPESKIVSRGNKIKIAGSTQDISKIHDILNSLIAHYHKYGKVSQENVRKVIEDDEAEPFQEEDEDVILYGSKGFTIKPKSENHRQLVELARNKDLVFASGPAGTGKTYISVAMGVRALKNKEVKKIIITRPAVEAGENLGYLPGDLKEKIDPYLRPIYDALEDMIPFEKLQYYLDHNIIEIAPLAYMRGRTINNAFILLDEAQNTTPMQIKMFLTRFGPKSRMIITGDKSQMDLPGNQKSGFIDAIDTLKNVDGIGFMELDSSDVIRHKLVKNIIEAYNKRQEKNQ